MKNLFLLLVLSALSLSATAQRKHSFTVGLQYVGHTKPSQWLNSDRLQDVDLGRQAYQKVGLWVGYEFKGRYAIRLQNSFLSQAVGSATVADRETAYVGMREANLYDLLLGYNVQQYLHLPAPVSCWVYAGAGITGTNAFLVDKNYTYIAAPDYCGEGLYSGTDYSYRAHPTAQVMIKYNPIRYVFVGVGGSYRYVGKDFQALAGNITLGFQL